jgi:broad specificity phosphatase PhoE
MLDHATQRDGQVRSNGTFPSNPDIVSTMKLIAVRHGETEWNVELRETGHLDSPLTPRGIQQAQALGHRLKGMGFDALYASDLRRAVQTAEIIGAINRKPVQLEPGLRERHMGVFQGLTRDEISEKYPEQMATYERIGFLDIIPGGESAQERTDRSVWVLTELASRHPEQTIVVVTHGGFLTGFLGFVLGIPFSNGRRFRKENASFNAFEYLEPNWYLQTWNDISHLEIERGLKPATSWR